MSRRTTTAPAADPAGPKSARTRGRILDATAVVLSRKGYVATRLGDIAEEAGLQATAIYYYFTSREELIAEVMAVGIESVRRHLDATLAALPGASGPMDRILAGVAAHLEVVLGLSNYAKAVIRNVAQIPPELGERRRQQTAEYRTDWLRMLQEAGEAGEMRPDISPRVAYGLVMGALNCTVEWWDPERETLEEVVRSAQALVRNGLAPQADSSSSELPTSSLGLPTSPEGSGS